MQNARLNCIRPCAVMPSTVTTGRLASRPLLIPFRPVVRLAEHLAVLDVGSAALAPRRHVVGVHFREFPHAGGVSVVTEGTELAVGCARGGCAQAATWPTDTWGRPLNM